jgi:hypothetical protein
MERRLSLFAVLLGTTSAFLSAPPRALPWGHEHHRHRRRYEHRQLWRNKDSALPSFAPTNLLETADNILSQKIREDAMEATTTTTTTTTTTPSNNNPLDNARNGLTQDDSGEASRRLFFGSALVAAGTLFGAADPALAFQVSTTTATSSSPTADALLPWQTNPVNKRSGITVRAAESTYNIAFVTYLSRFLLNFDAAIQSWWFSQKLPKDKPADQVRREQFGALSASVEVGLQAYPGKEGARQLLELLLARYCTDSLLPVTGDISLTQKQRRQRREIKEARRQIALLFALLDKEVQPTKDITKLLAAVDNGCVESVVVQSDRPL